MNATRLYDRLCAEIEKEKNLDEFDRIMFKALIMQALSDEQRISFQEFCEEQKKFNALLEKSLTHLELINNIDTYKN